MFSLTRSVLQLSLGVCGGLFLVDYFLLSLSDLKLKCRVDLGCGVVISFFRLGLSYSQLLQHGVGDGEHHGCGGCVADPHGQEG